MSGLTGDAGLEQPGDVDAGAGVDHHVAVGHHVDADAVVAAPRGADRDHGLADPRRRRRAERGQLEVGVGDREQGEVGLGVAAHDLGRRACWPVGVEISTFGRTDEEVRAAVMIAVGLQHDARAHRPGGVAAGCGR